MKIQGKVNFILNTLQKNSYYRGSYELISGAGPTKEEVEVVLLQLGQGNAIDKNHVIRYQYYIPKVKYPENTNKLAVTSCSKQGHGRKSYCR